jgi:hypothetical protein
MVHLMNMLWRAFQSSWQRAREKILLCEPIQIVTLFRVRPHLIDGHCFEGDQPSDLDE